MQTVLLLLINHNAFQLLYTISQYAELMIFFVNNALSMRIL